MDFMSWAMPFASVVGLLGLFRQERGRQEDQSSKAFLEWLTAHGFQNLKDQLSGSQLFLEQIDSLLRQNHEELLSRLDRIDKALATVVGRIEGPDSLAASLRPEAQLSDQAVSILRQLVNSDSEEFGVIPNRKGADLRLTRAGGVQVTEQQFLNDDLNTLVELGLLRTRYGSQGGEFYGVTRNAVRFIEAIDGNEATN